MNLIFNRIFILVSGLTTAAVGLLVLIGWQFNVDMLYNADIVALTMKANTAFAFLLSGLALILLQQPVQIYKIWVRVGGFFIALIGLLSLSQYIVGWDLGIDEMLFHIPAHTVVTSSPGSMAFGTALNFALIGTTFIVFTFRSLRNKFIVSLAVVISLVISVLGLLNFTTTLVGFAKIGSLYQTPMAFLTSLTFVVLCTGLLTSLHKGQSQSVSTKQRLFTGHILGAAIIAFVYLLFYSNIKIMSEVSLSLSQSQEVKKEINLMLADVINLENGSQGLIATNANSYLTPLFIAKERLPIHLFHLRLLITHPSQKLSLDTLTSLTKRRIVFTENLFNSNSTKESYAGVASVHTGKILSDSIRCIATKMILASNNMLNTGAFSKSDTLKNNQRILYASLFIQLFLLFMVFIFVVKYIITKKKSEHALRESNDELECKVHTRTKQLLEINKDLVVQIDEKKRLTSQLEFFQIALNTKNEELLQTKEVAEISAEKYTELYNFAPASYFTFTKEGEIVDLNIQGSLMLGDEQKNLIRSSFGFFVSEETRPVFNHFLERVYNSKMKEACELTIINGNNLRREVNLTGIAGRNNNLCLVTAIDDTERKRSEEENKKLSRVYAVLSSINQAIVRIAEKQELYEEVCRIAVEEGKFRMAWIGILDEHANKVIPVAAAGYAKEYIKTINIDLNDKNFGNGPTGRTIRSGVHFLSNDIANNPEMIFWREHALKLGCRSVASFPIQESGKTIGVILLYSDQTFSFNQEETKLFDEMAMDISYACEFIENKAIRKKAEENLHESNERFKHLASNLNEVVWYASIDGSGVTEANDSFEKIYGIAFDKFAGNPGIWIDMVHPDDRHLADWSEKMLFEKGIVEVEYRIIRPDGLVIWILDKKSIINDENGKPFQISGIAKDITERKNSEEALLLSNARNLAILNAIPDLMFRINCEGVILDYRVQASSNLYSAPELIIGSKVSDLMPPRVASLINKHIRHLLESGEMQVFEYELSTGPNQEYYEARMVISSAFEIVAIIHDITERKLIAEKVKKSEKKYRNLVNEVNDGFYIIDKQGFLTFANKGLAKILGFAESEELIGRNIREFIPEDSLAKVIGNYGLSIKNKISTGNFELNAIQINGQAININISYVLILEKDQAVGFRGIIRDISEQKHTEKLKREQSEILESIIRRTPIPVILELIVKLAESENQKSFCSIFLLNEEGTHLHVVAAPSLPEFYRRANDNLEVGENNGSNGAAAFLKKPAIAEDVLTHPNWIPYRKFAIKANLRSCWSLPILDSKDNVLGTFSIYHSEPKSPSSKDLEILKSLVDLTSIAITNNRVEEEIQKANADLEIKVDKRTIQLSETNKKLTNAKVIAEDANRMKSEFLANMSHEIRTPLNSIVGFSSILKEKLCGQNIFVEYLDNILVSSSILLNLINDILDLSKVEAGRMVIDLQPVNLDDIVKEVQSVFQIKALEKGLSLNFIIQNDIPKSLITDERYLRQILLNLIGNAVKFTHKGSVDVLIDVLPKDVEGSKIDLKFSVKDTGIGVPADQLLTIFDPFIQASKKDRNRYGGTGLGLSITRRLVELLGGTIFVESEEDKGSVFCFSLSNVEIGSLQCDEKNNNINRYLSGIKFKKPVLLLTEDILSNRQVIKGYLETLNITIIEAENGEECLSAIQKQRPDLILMDMQMPVMDGYTAIKIIKSDKLLESIPIVALTASGMKQQKDHIQNIADDFLIKPIYKNELIVKLMKYLAYDESSIVEMNEEINEELIQNEYTQIPIIKQFPPEKKEEITSLFLDAVSKQLEALNFDEVIALVIKLEEYNKNKQVPEISECCNQLSSYIKSFNIEKINVSLVQLLSYIRK